LPLKKKDKKEIFGFIAPASSHLRSSSQLCFLGGETAVEADCVPEKVACLKERAGTLVFQPHYTIHSGEALCTYSLYDKQVNGAGAWQTERFIKPFLASIS